MLGREFTIEKIANITSCKIAGAALSESVDQIATDSRYGAIGSSTLFIAIKTDRNDGHNYLTHAYSKGIRFFIISDNWTEKQLEDCTYLICPDPKSALQKLAGYYRNTLDYPIIGVTGSNGKTIVKEWLFQLLSTKMKTGRSPKSYNSQIGVPISLLVLPQKLDIAIIEAGISEVGEMEKLEEMIHPRFGIITNIHSAHIQNFNDRKELVKEKLGLFKSCETVIYRKDYDLIHELIVDFNIADLLCWSLDKEKKADITVQVEIQGDITKISIPWKDGNCEFRIPYVDDASIENAIHSVISALKFDIQTKQIDPVTIGFQHTAMRLQQIEAINNCTLINDAYTSDLTSLEIALNFLKIQSQHPKKTLIISDIIQSGIASDMLYKRVKELCSANSVDRIIAIGPEISDHLSSFNCEKDHFNSTEEFLTNITSYPFYDEAILLKGSRSFGFERISRQLEYKKHETSLEVNLSAMIDNLGYFRSKLKAETKIMVMVKAFSYGAGSYEIANVLEHYGVDYLAVAYIDEGIVLRKNGVLLPIVVMNPAMGGMEEMVENDLEPEIYSLNALNIADGFTKSSGKGLRIHLKLETGMHRLGVESAELEQITSILNANDQLEIASVFSHLVASDDESKDEISLDQIRRLDQFCDSLHELTGKPFFRHVLNSDGINRFTDHQKDMVRLGIGLYGISSVEQVRKDLKPVLRLKSVVSQLKNVRKGESVGYARSFRADRDMRTATIPIGYADGLARELGNGNWYFEINGQKAEIIGNVCMDMCMVDVTDIKGIVERDEVFILGSGNNIYKMAEIRQTIPYEIMTSFSERVKRVFYYGE